MTDAPYTGFEPLSHETAKNMEPSAVQALVAIAERFMLEEAPLMGVRAGVLPNIHRRVTRETCEEEMGQYAHRILIDRKLKISFIIAPLDLAPEDASIFLSHAAPQGEHLVLAAKSYAPGTREALAQRWSKHLVLLTFAGTEKNHDYALWEG
jgi:hypothetical protein